VKLDAIKAEAERISFIADHYKADSPSQQARTPSPNSSFA
jgi:hypothetical protein